MTWWAAFPLALILWWLWEIRRALHLRLLPTPIHVEGPSEATVRPPEAFQGAVAPNRYVVIRWPTGLTHYGGAHPTHAKQVYEHQHPIPGEAVELWEQGTCRAHKEA